MSGFGGPGLARRTGGSAIAYPLLPYGVHVAARAQSPDPTKPPGSVQVAIRREQPDAAGVWRRAPEGAAWDYGGVAHLESDLARSLSSALHRDGRRRGAGRRALGRFAGALFVPGARAEPNVSGQIFGRTQSPLRWW